MRVWSGIVIAALAGAAHADPADDDVARGEAFGKQGDWSRAIDAFKAADRATPRAKHACLIGLAYSRRELWAEAELFFSLCHQRATPDDAPPEWLPDAERQLADKLAASNASAITLRVEPVEALIAVSSFAPDETFHSRTIHLTAGAHVITVTAPGYELKKQEIVVAPNAPREVRISLQRPRPRSNVPIYLYVTAGALVAAGVGVDELVVQPARNQLEVPLRGTYDVAVQNGARDRIQLGREIAVGAFAGAALALGVGLLVHRLDAPPPVQIGTDVGRGGAMITVGGAL